ncbi:MAG: MATE family efflux transporter [Ruminococcus sp.]|nr:MATE family efflux transporter [Ruminococcus sp.]
MEKEYFESAPILKSIAKFAVPTVLSQMVTLIYNLADTFFVGQTNDPNQIAALTLSFPIFMLLVAVANLMGIGANSLISRSLGMNKPEQAKKASAFGFYGAIVVTVIYSAALLVFMKPVLTVVGASPDTYAYTKSYLIWTVVIGGVPTVMNLVMGHLIRAEGNSKQASIGTALGGVINILLDPVLVLVLDMGITGAAVATAISNFIGMIYFFVVIYKNREKTVVSLKPKHISLSRKIISEVILVGFPAALVILLGSAGNIVLTHYMSPYGDINVAAFGIVQKVGSIAIQISVGLTQGIMPLIGYNYAAGNHNRTKAVCKVSFAILIIYAVFCVGIVELFPNTIISIFIDEQQTVALGVDFVKRWIVCAPGMCMVMMLNSIFQAMGKWKQSMFLSVFRQAVLLIPLLIVMNSVMGKYGLVFSQPLSDTISMIIGFILYFIILKGQKEEVQHKS